LHTHGPVRRINAHGTRHGAKHGQLYWGTVPDSERYGCEGAGTNQTCPTRSRGSCGAGHQGLVPGTKNPADLFTKNLANIGEKRHHLRFEALSLREQECSRDPGGGTHAYAQIEEEDQEAAELGDRQKPQRYEYLAESAESDTDPGAIAQRRADDAPASEILASRGSVDATLPPEDRLTARENTRDCGFDGPRTQPFKLDDDDPTGFQHEGPHTERTA